MQLVRLHWIGTISGRAPPPDVLPCTAPASKSGQGRWVVREEERGEAICCGQGREQKGEGEAGEQSTVHQENAQKQPPANAHASAMHCHTPAMVARGKRAARERGEGGKVTRVPDCTGRGEGGEGTQARACGSRDEHVGRCWCQLTAPHCTGHRAHTRRASKREEWECEQKKKEEPKG